MRTYILHISFLCFFTFSVVSLFSEELIKKPNSELINSQDEIIGKTNYERGATNWVVFSNQKNNAVYNDSYQVSSNDVGFLEAFNVVGETADKVKVKRLDKRNSDGSSSSGAVIGWMNKTDLILLDHCERKSNKVSKKAMIINLLDKTSQKDMNNLYRFFYDPALVQRNMNERHSVYEILYVYKVTDKALLLGKREDCSVDPEKYLKESMIGWIDKSFVTEWNSRGCLLPNYKSEARAERATKFTQPAILDTTAKYQSAISLAKGYDSVLLTYPKLKEFAGIYATNPIVWNDETTTTRWSPSKFRLPYLDKHSTDADIMKVGVLGDITDEQGKQIQTLIDKLREWEREHSEKNTLNLVFVIDGTASMKNYFPAVADAITLSQESISKDPDFSNVDNPNRVRIQCGAVVYRDTPEGQYLVEPCPLQDFTSTKTWIKDNFKDIKNANDRDIPEAVYYGLYYALEDVLSGHEQENNLIILIGDAGDSQRDDESFTAADTLINDLYKYNCNFIAFQTHWLDPKVNPDYQSYTDFCTQMRTLSEQSARLIQTKIGGIDQLDLQKQVSLVNIESKSNYELYGLDYPFLSNKVYCNKGTDLDANRLRELIVESIKSSSKNVSLVVKFIHEILYSGLSWEEILRKYNISADDMKDLGPIATTLGYIVGELTKIYPGRNVTAPGGELEKLLSGKLQLYFEGYTPLKIDGTKYNLWTFEILAIAQTKKNLEQDFLKVINAFKNVTSEEDQRGRVYNAFLSLAQTYAGDESQFDEMKIGILFSKIIDCPGLKFSSTYREPLEKKIKDIKLESNCPYTFLETYYKEISRSYNQIKNLSFEGYVTTAFGTYSAYYIPVELMPFSN